jgi:hypothetical protein
MVWSGSNSTKGDRNRKPQLATEKQQSEANIIHGSVPVGFHSVRSSFPESTISPRRYAYAPTPPRPCFSLNNYWIIIPSPLSRNNPGLLPPVYSVPPRWTAVGRRSVRA